MKKEEAQDIASQAATDLSAMIIDATPRIHGYLDGTATDVEPLGAAVILIAIGARQCGFSEARLAKLLLKLDADGVFQISGPEQVTPSLADVAASAPHMKHAFS